jgi:hypothetical protein
MRTSAISGGELAPHGSSYGCRSNLGITVDIDPFIKDDRAL